MCGSFESITNDSLKLLCHFALSELHPTMIACLLLLSLSAQAFADVVVYETVRGALQSSSLDSGVRF